MLSLNVLINTNVKKKISIPIDKDSLSEFRVLGLLS